MSFFSPQTRAEASDRMAMMTGWAAMLASAIYALDVIQAFVEAPLSRYLNDAQLIGAALIVAIFLPSFFLMKRRFGGPSINPWKEDGFMSAVFQRAALSAFALTFAVMTLLTTLDSLVLDRVTTQVLLDLVIAISLASFSLFFFIYSHHSDPGEAG